MAAAAAGSHACHLRIHNGLSLVKGCDIYAVQRDPVNHVEAIFEIDEDENEEMVNTDATLMHTAGIHSAVPTRQKYCAGESEHKERINPQVYMQMPIQYVDRTLRWCRSDDIPRNLPDITQVSQKEIIHIDTAPTSAVPSDANNASACTLGTDASAGDCATFTTNNDISSSLVTQSVADGPVQSRVQGAPFAAYVFSAHPNKIALLYKSFISQDGTAYKSGELVYVKHSAFVPDATQQYKALKSRAWGEVVAFVELFTCERYEHASQDNASTMLSLSQVNGGDGRKDYDTSLTDSEIANGILITDANELGLHVSRHGRKYVHSNIQLLFNWGLYPSDLKAYYPDLEDIYKGMPRHNKYSRFLSNYEQIVSVKAIDFHMLMKDAKHISVRFNVNTSEVEAFSFSETVKRAHAVAHTNINPLQYVLNSIACDKESMDNTENDEELNKSTQEEHQTEKQKKSSTSVRRTADAVRNDHSGKRSGRKRPGIHEYDSDYLEEEEIFIAESDEDDNAAIGTRNPTNVDEEQVEEDEEEEEECKQTDPTVIPITHSQAVSSRKRRRCVEEKAPGDSQNSDDAPFVEGSQDTTDSGNNEQSISLEFVPRSTGHNDPFTVDRHAALFKDAVFWNTAFLHHAPFWKTYVEDKFQFYRQLSCNNQELSVLNALISNMWKMDSYHIRPMDGSCCFCKLRRSLSVAVILPMHGQTTNYAGACCFEKVKKVVIFVEIFEKYRERLLRQYHAFATPNVLSMAQFQKAVMPHVWKTEFMQFETELNEALHRLKLPNFA